jgi:hypothetical protein
LLAFLFLHLDDGHQADTQFLNIIYPAFVQILPALAPISTKPKDAFWRVSPAMAFVPDGHLAFSSEFHHCELCPSSPY